MDLLEYPAEISLVLESRLLGNFVYRIIGIEQPLRGKKNAVPREVFPWGEPGFPVEYPGQVIFAEIYRLRQSPPGYRRGRVQIEIEDGFLDQGSSMWREQFLAGQKGCHPCREFG